MSFSVRSVSSKIGKDVEMANDVDPDRITVNKQKVFAVERPFFIFIRSRGSYNSAPRANILGDTSLSEVAIHFWRKV